MKRTISSSWTLFIKVFSSCAIITLSIGVLLDLFRSSHLSIGDRIAGLFWVLGMCFFLYWFHARLKKVSVDDNNLYVSYYLKEIPIPLSKVRGVSQFIGGNGFVTIRLISSSEFGSQIRFMPKWRPFALFSPHPVVYELMRLIESNRKANGQI